MLARTSLATHHSTIRVSSCIVSQQRYFDYFKIAKDVEAGKSLEDIENDRAIAKQTKAAASFSWDFINWYQKNLPEGFAHYSHIRSKYNPFEQFIGDRGAASTTKAINFDEFRNKIADTKFVDELEITYHVERNTLSSITDLSTLNSWSQPKLEEFEQECKDSGNMLMKPQSDAVKADMQRQLIGAEECDEKNKDGGLQMQKEFEQLDVERLMFGQETYQMRLSEHPQFAENVEDIVASRQHNHDIPMMPYHHEFVKRERLAQIQDEERRKVFLERYELSAKINNGEDPAMGGGGH